MKTLVTYRDNRWRADVGVCRCWRRLVVTGRFIKQRDTYIDQKHKGQEYSFGAKA